MADTRLRYRTDILPLRIESGRLFIPGELASEILNLYLTEEGTLRSIWGPCPYVPPYVVEFTEVIKDMGESKKNADSKRVSMSTTQASLFNTDYYISKLSSTDRNDRSSSLGPTGTRNTRTSTSGTTSTGGGAAPSNPGSIVVNQQYKITNRVQLHYPYYGEMHGVFHARLSQGSRDALLIQTDNQIWVLDGWQAGSSQLGTPAPWRVLAYQDSSNLPAYYSTAASPEVLQTQIQADMRPRAPAQFERTPAGIVIIPRGETAVPLFYDGEVILPLGYSTAPGPPTGAGPHSEGSTTIGDANTKGFAKSASNTSWPPAYGFGRIGTVNLDSEAANASRLEDSLYLGATQWMDRWGNLSPRSGFSSPVTIQRTGKFTDLPDAHLKIFQWSNIETGPTGTIGRLLLRTRDTKHAGTADLFEIPANSAGGVLSYATIPDNLTSLFPDNVPDSWLILPSVDPVAVKPFRLYKVAFGRGWAANFRDDAGKIHPTMVGRWGTFLRGEEIYPDPQGAEITGIHPTPQGLFVFTASSTYLITENSEGTGFRSQTINARVGCVAPSSIVTMPTGEILWLGREGFYVYFNGQFELASADISRELLNINWARAVQASAAFDSVERKYRCWVPANGSLRNNLCWCWDGQGFTRRDDVGAADVCVSDDHRRYMIAVGRCEMTDTPDWLVDRKIGSTDYTLDLDGVWLLDHQNVVMTPARRMSSITTAWLRAPRSDERGSPLTVYLWMRESESGTLSVDVMRDWRDEIVHTETFNLHPTDDVPPFWGPDDTLASTYAGTDPEDGSDLIWVRRRPFWTRIDIYVPSAEVFKLRLYHSGSWEFIGMAFDETSQKDTFRSGPK